MWPPLVPMGRGGAGKALAVGAPRAGGANGVLVPVIRATLVVDPRVDKDFGFCGQPRVRGPYCREHAVLAYERRPAPD
jgi:hypothetical protein